MPTWSGRRRAFTADPLAIIHADRGKYIAAILIIARAYVVAGRPRKLAALASYLAWSDLVRSALVWLGEADPVATIEAAAGDDPDAIRLAAALEHWPAELESGESFTTAELMKKATARHAPAHGENEGPLVSPDFHEALRAVATDRRGNLSADTLGKWLRDHKNRVVGARKLVRGGSPTRAVWAVIPAGRASGAQTRGGQGDRGDGYTHAGEMAADNSVGVGRTPPQSPPPLHANSAKVVRLDRKATRTFRI